MQRPERLYIAVLCCALATSLAAAPAQIDQQTDTPKGLFLDAPHQMAPDAGEATVLLPLGLDRWTPGGDWIRSGEVLELPGSGSGAAQIVLDLPAVGTGERMLLEFRERFTFESDHDAGVVRVSADAGATWIEVGRRSGRCEGREACADLTSWAGSRVLVELTAVRDNSIDGDGWTVSNLNLVARGEKDTSVSLYNINHTDFPFIFMNLSVREDGVDVPGLPDEAFTVYEDGVLQTGSFDVVAPDEGGGVRVADIVFVIDSTGSMSEEIASVRTNMASFVNALAASSIDFRIGFVRFWDNVDVMNGGNLLEDYGQIMATINSIGANGGDDTPENQLESMVAASRMNFRPGAHRVQIMITDANAHEADWATEWTVESTIAQLQATGSVVYPVFYTGDASQRAQYVPIAENTNPDGDYYNIYDNFNGIIGSIQESLALTYIVRYRTSNGAFDGVEREVRIEVDAGDVAGSAIGHYVPGAAPEITRTAETVALSERSWAVGTPIAISVRVTDPIAPHTTAVTLHYRHMAAATFQPRAMTTGGDGIWRADLPVGVVAQPGFDYYLSATDGVNVTALPSYEPHLNPFSVGVLPNVVPDIVFSPPAPQTLTPGEDVVLAATITDGTNELVAASLHYKTVGEAIWRELLLTPAAGDVFTVTIPGEHFPAAGVLAYLEAWDDVGSHAYDGLENPHLIRAWLTSPDDRLVFRIETTTSSAVVRSVRVLGDTDWRSPKAYHVIAEKAVGDDGMVRFTRADLDGMEHLVDEEIRRLELMGVPGDVVGHLNFHYTNVNYRDGKRIEAFLYLHDDDAMPRIRAGNGIYSPFYDLHGGWEDYDPADEEYLVSMLVPPEERIDRIDATHRDPVVLVHGIYGLFPYWYSTDTHVEDLDGSGRRGGLPFHLDGYDTWSFYYPYDIRIPHASVLLGRALDVLLGEGGVANTGEYHANAAVVAHSMGGLVTRGVLADPAYRGNVSKLLMYATPNHGSFSSFRMLYEGWTPVTGGADLVGKDRASPAHFDLSPGSAFLRWLDAEPLRNLTTPGSGGDYLVVAGRDDLNWVGFLHDEILDQEDGVVAVSSASLLDEGVPLVVVDHNHVDIHQQFREGRTIEIAETFLGGGASPDLESLSGWYDCLIEDLDGAADCSTVRNDVGLLNVELPGVDVDEFLVETVGDDPDRLNIIAEGRTLADPAQRLLPIPATDVYFSFLDYLIATNEMTWTPPRREIDVPEAGDSAYDAYFYRQGFFSPALIGYAPDALRTRPVASVSETIELTDAAVDALNGHGGDAMIAKDAAFEINVDRHVSTVTFVLNFAPTTTAPAVGIEDPLGRLWTVDDLDANASLAVDLSPEHGFFVASYDDPMAGVWRLVHPDAMTPTAAEGFVDGEIIATIEVASGAEVEPGDDLEVTVTVDGYQLMTDIDVDLVYTRIDGGGEATPETVDLETLDNHIFTGTASTTTSGLYELRLAMNGVDNGGEEVVRSDIASFRVGRASGTVELESGGSAFFPNPLDPGAGSGFLAFDAPVATTWTLTIFDTAGHTVLSRDLGHIEAGQAGTAWDGRDSRGDVVANGVYFGVLAGETGDRIITKIAILR